MALKRSLDRVVFELRLWSDFGGFPFGKVWGGKCDFSDFFFRKNHIFLKTFLSFLNMLIIKNVLDSLNVLYKFSLVNKI